MTGEQKHVENLMRHADDAFKNHALIPLTPYADDAKAVVFRCAEPGTGIYSFNVVIVAGGQIAVMGDVGDIILKVNEPHVGNVIAWIRGLGRNSHLDYFISKAQPVCRASMEEFSVETAREQLAEWDQPCDADCEWLNGEGCGCGKSYDRKTAQRVRENWDGDTFESWCESCYDATDDSEFPRCLVPSPSAVWSYMALRKFVELYDEMSSK